MQSPDGDTLANRTRIARTGASWLAPAWFFVFAGVVNTAAGQGTGRAPFSSTEALFEYVSESVCTISAVGQDGSLFHRGSGFILKDGGLLVTNAHVLAGLDKATVKCGGQYADIEEITHYDRKVDLLLARTGELDVPGLTLSTRPETKPGAQIYVVGSPFGLEGTISPGLASGHREIRAQSYVQISAPISAGSSGGPVVDRRGAVIGVTVASLEVAQNINFALPAAVITELPEARMPLADLGTEESEMQGQPAVAVPPVSEDFIASEAFEFRGFPFGTPCGEVAIAEYRRKRAVAGPGGSIRFAKWYAGTLEFDVRLHGAPVTLFYDCDDRFGMVAGYYRISGHSETVAKVSGALRAQYGPGVSNPISEREAAAKGCRWNFSIPGSRHYRPSEWTTWHVDDRFVVEMLLCGADSRSTFVFYGDPVLIEATQQAERQARGAMNALRAGRPCYVVRAATPYKFWPCRQAGPQ